MSAPNFRTLDLNLLRVFDQVMSERNLTRAARNLNMTQPAVSNALNRLRDALGDRLVVRSGYGVEPTPRALALWPVISDSLRQLEAVILPGEFNPAEATQSFTLAMADATAAELMPGLVKVLQRDAPGVSIRCVPLTTRDPRRLLDEAQIDLALGYFPAVIADLTAQAQAGGLAAFDHQRLYDGRYVCVMRKGHPLATGTLTLKKYCAAQHLLVSFSGRPFGFTDEALAALGQQRRIVLTVNQFFTAGLVVTTSDLLTVLPAHFISTTGRASELAQRELPFAVPAVHVDALWHRRQGVRSDHAWLRAAVTSAAAAAFAQGHRQEHAQ
ncbi:MAG: transcriptional regulator, LysR family-like protein [Ramlibacter sp.]|jgi:DNA-binding transcriptional LysR family regulator|uniref:LysR family transcriptional regulator n=1 Tax=Ramlibacter sp. TaxID=1917967 RepID=UPI0026111EAC|nr:LysR family transcriptional regulator [Ramlibacter sp.]MDB5750851.1 transcriptional regulator, LysR family-like protein [Ramlibacter sp.]